MNTTCFELFLLIVNLQILDKHPDEDMDMEDTDDRSKENTDKYMENIDEIRDEMHILYVEIPQLSEEDVLSVLSDSDVPINY